MKIKLSTGSTADIPKNLLAELDITSLPLTIALGEQEWLDGVTVTPEGFYETHPEAEASLTIGQEPELTYQVGCIIALNTGPNMVELIFRS